MDIKAKIAKLLRMQESSNVNEAANAAHLIQALCQKHGVTVQDCQDKFDPERDVAVFWTMGRVFKRVDPAFWNLLDHVATYFNGTTVNTSATKHFDFNLDTCNQTHRVIEVIATKGNKVQIELYFDYLCEVMEKMADEAKMERLRNGYYGDRGFKSNFRKGFARAIGIKLRDQKRAEQIYQERQKVSDKPAPDALALFERNKIEKEQVLALVKRRFPKLGKSNGSSYGGSGTEVGFQAGKSTSTQRQVNRVELPRLTGG